MMEEVVNGSELVRTVGLLVDLEGEAVEVGVEEVLCAWTWSLRWVLVFLL